MKGADGFVQGYNAQLAVDEEAQVIVARGVTDQPPDNGNLAPMIERVQGHLDETPANATADAGYWNPEAEDRARALGTEAWVSTERRRRGGAKRSGSEAEPPDGEADPLKRMRSRLANEEGRALYARRKAVVEPVNGQIKHARWSGRPPTPGARISRVRRTHTGCVRDTRARGGIHGQGGQHHRHRYLEEVLPTARSHGRW